jgi:hypothetical protein
MGSEIQINRINMKSFREILKDQAEQIANQKYFNMLAHNKWLPAIRMKDSRTSEKPNSECLPRLFLLLEPGKEN